MLTGFVKIPHAGDSRRSDVPAVHDDPTGRIVEAHDHFDFENNGYTLTEEDVARWAKIFHGLHLEYDSEHGGYWFVDPDQLVENFWDASLGGRWMYANDELTKAEVEAKIIESEQETYRQWAEGDVYGVILERKVAWAKLSADGGTVLQGEGTVRETWENEGSVWGCYLDDEYTAQVVAKEHFDLTDEEEQALGLS